MRNVEVTPQGTFRQAPGLRAVAKLRAVLTNMRLRSFTSADGSITEHVWSDSHGDVYNAGGNPASYTIPYSAAQLPTVKMVQQLDTLLAFHKDVAPRRLLRTGSDASWNMAAAPLVHIPLHDYGGADIHGTPYSNGVAAQWVIRFVGEPNNVDSIKYHYVATLSGEESLAMQFAATGLGLPDYPAFAATIKTALEALPGVSPGLTVVYAIPAGQPEYTVRFTGSGNEGDGWALAFRCLDKTDIACPTFRLIKGVTPGEPVISDDRGYPRCGVLYQQRLLMGGLKSLPNAWMASFSGDYYDFNTLGAAANGAMLVPMDSEGGEAIEEMIGGRSLLILTSLGEYFLADRALSKASPPNHVETSRHGALEGVPSVENEGSAIFAQKSGGVLFEFHYDDVGQTFVTQNLSLLASHLVDGVSDAALQRSTKDNDANQLYITLASGAARVFSLLREQNVTAGTRRDTPGLFKAVAARSDNVLGAIVERTITGGAIRTLEHVEQNLLLDQALTKTLAPPSRSITGLADYEGQSVWVIADDDVLGPFTVAGAQIADIGQVATVVTVGRWTAPLVETLPIPRDVGPGIVVERKARIHTVRLSLLDTTSIAVGANGGKIYDIPLFRFGGTLDSPALANKFTGMIKIQGLTGYADEPTVTITQKRPGFMHVRGITVEAAL